MRAELTTYRDGDVELDVMVWRLVDPMIVASTASCGGGVGARDWIVNAQVAHDFERRDLDQYVAGVATGLGLRGSGVGMLTAARVRRHQRVLDDGVEVDATVGLSHPAWAAANDEADDGAGTTGTINVVVRVPVHLEEGALLNALVTATEAKSQALYDAGVAGTGTPSDAVCICCRLEGSPERFAGPRSRWGARLARGVYGAVLAGAREWVA